MKISRTFAITVICIVLGITISLQYKSIYTNEQMDVIQNIRLEDLKDQLLLEKRNNEDLRRRNNELEEQNRKFENAYGDINAIEQSLKSELERARIIAGLTDVKGAGIVVTLDNSEYGMVEAIDILSVINELRASDAQAISINEERIVALTEVREAGRYIVINGRQKMAPFVIKAIAEPANLENALKVVGGVAERLQELYKINFTIEKRNELIIPKVRDDGTVIKIDLLTPVYR